MKDYSMPAFTFHYRLYIIQFRRLPDLCPDFLNQCFRGDDPDDIGMFHCPMFHGHGADLQAAGDFVVLSFVEGDVLAEEVDD